jgi:hypothetical protein
VSTPLIIRRDRLYLCRETYERYFLGHDAVILLRRDDDLLVLPVHHAAAGGYLLKVRNAEGDRVVDAADFLRTHGLDDSTELQLTAAWNSPSAGLLAHGIFQKQDVLA